jgi:hypothetical protein
MTNAERAARYIARLKAAAQAPSPSVCPHCGGSLVGAAAKAGATQSPETEAESLDQSTTRRNLTDADIAGLPIGLHRLAKGLVIGVGQNTKSFQFRATRKGHKRFYKAIGHWPEMSVAQARAEAARLHRRM